jgi:hypothetical protein
VEKGIQGFFELWAGPGTSHGAFHAHLQSYFFEFFTVLVLTVIYCMDQLMNQGVDDVKGFIQGGRNKDLVDGIA